MTEHPKFLVSDYLATGEGRTIMLMVTHHEDHEAEFKKRFGDYFATCMEVIDEKEMILLYGDLIPKWVKTKETEVGEVPWFEWYSSFHFNLS